MLTVREDEANGEIASLFADIRSHLGTSFVNLVFRQFMDGSALVAPLAAGSLDPASHPDPPPPIETMAQFPDPADVAPHVVDLAWRLNALGKRGDGTTGQLVDQLAAPVPEPDGPTRNAIRIALEDFGRNAIVKVIPITRVLLAALGSGGGLGLPLMPSQR